MQGTKKVLHANDKSLQSIFEPYLKSFFVRNSDPTHIKLLKLEILTNLATATSISLILREFQTYISSSDKDFVAATIQAIGRCAATIHEVTDTCLSGLVRLLSNKDGELSREEEFQFSSSLIDHCLISHSEYVVAESVVVIKKLLQTQSDEHQDIISQMAKLLDFIAVSAARAAIIWLIGEYSHRVPTIAPDVLRKVAKTFPDESNIVKLQALNLSVKLYLTNAEQTALLCQYVFNLAKYDQNYDIRDRARFLRGFIFPEGDKETILSRNAKKIFLATKPAPVLESKHCDREQYQLGSLSHLLNMRVSGYQDLPDFPEVAPDPTARNIELPILEEHNQRQAEPLLVQEGGEGTKKKKSRSSGAGGREKSAEKKFYSDESDKGNGGGGTSEYTEDSESSSSSSSDSDSSSSSSDDDDKKTPRNGQVKKAPIAAKKQNKDPQTNGGSTASSSSASSSSSSSSSSDNSGEDGSSSDDGSSSSSSSSVEVVTKKVANKTDGQKKTNLDLLLDLDAPPEVTLATPSLGGFLSPMTTSSFSVVSGGGSNEIEFISAKFVASEHQELLSKASCYGLEVMYRFTRAPNLFSPKMTTIELILTNHSNSDIGNVAIGQKVLSQGMQMKEFQTILNLPPKGSLTTSMGIDFHDSCQAVNFEITSSCGIGKVSLKAPVGELMRAVNVPEVLFKSERNKLRGMTEHTMKIPAEGRTVDTVKETIYKVANVGEIQSSEDCVYQFAAQTLSSRSLVLITVVQLAEELQFTVNCDKMVVGSILLNDLKTAFQ